MTYDVRRFYAYVWLFLVPLAGCTRQSDSTSLNLPASAAINPSDPANGQEDAISPEQEERGSASSTLKPREGETASTSDVVEITFDDLNLNMQPDVVFRPWMLEYNDGRAKELDGKRVRVSGYMLPDVQRRGITEFVLLRNKECKFGPGGQADHLVQVIMQKDVTTSFTDRAVTVEGILTIEPFQGLDRNTWKIYDLAGEKVRVRR